MCVGCSVVSHSVTAWTAAHQAPLSMGSPRQEDWSGELFPAPGDLPHPGTELTSLVAPALAGGSLPLSHRGSPALLEEPCNTLLCSDQPCGHSLPSHSSGRSRQILVALLGRTCSVVVCRQRCSHPDVGLLGYGLATSNLLLGLLLCLASLS